MKKIFRIGFAIVILAQTVQAQDTTNSKQLGEVVVTGQYKPQSVKNSVYQVRVITKERIQKQGATRLQDVLSNDLNIRFSYDPATGGSNITMMGMRGQNVKVLLDGVPMVGRQGTTNEININQIDVNSIERIEIVEGPMSVIYGADALAGVINIITKKAGPAAIAVTARLQEETVGKEYGVKQGIHTQYVGLTLRNKGWEAGGNFGYNYFGGWKGDSTGRELTWHWKDQIIANGFLGYSNDRFNIRYRIDGLDEIITNPGNFKDIWPEAADTLAHDQEYLSRRVMQQLNAGYYVNGNLSFTGQASYTDYRRQVFSYAVSKNTGKLSMDPADMQSIDKLKGFTFRGTAFYKLSNSVSFQPGVDINTESGEGQRLKAGNNKIEDYAFFITSEITPSSKISIRPGLRFIKNSVYNAPPVIPSINAKLGLGKNLDLRVAYARGFRAPSLRELYFNFIDATHTVLGNPDLKAETSHSVTASLAWNKVATNNAVYTVTLNTFYNDVKNLIDYAFSATSDTAIVANVSNSKTTGATLVGNMKYNNWNISAGVGYTGFYNDYSETDNTLGTFEWSPEINGTVGYSFSKIGLNANLFYKYTGKKPFYTQVNQAVELAHVEDYQMADFTLNKTFAHSFLRYFTLSAGIRNLFDTKFVNSTLAATGSVHTSGASNNLAYGRSYFAGLVFNWNKK